MKARPSADTPGLCIRLRHGPAQTSERNCCPEAVLVTLEHLLWGGGSRNVVRRTAAMRVLIVLRKVWLFSRDGATKRDP